MKKENKPSQRVVESAFVLIASIFGAFVVTVIAILVEIK